VPTARSVVVFTASALALIYATSACAQPPTLPPACPPGVTGDPPTLGGPPSDKPLSDRLADSKGVICPPAGIDPEIRKPPPDGGALRVIPPPGSPGGDPSVQPK
jgi:hypothetical protein